MPPDISGLPPSPRPINSSNNPSRRPSQIISQSRTNSNLTASESSGGVPVRHPRPLTPAELHLELEREQESIVNRLTRELAQLRAQSASAASNHSNSSHSSSAIHDTVVDGPSQPQSATQPYFPLTGPTHPTPSRVRRSSSSVSRRSDASQAAMPPPPAPIGSSQASVDRARDAAGSITSPLQRSRQNSTVLPTPATHRPASTAPSPSPSPSQRNSTVLGENTNLVQTSYATARPPSISLSSSMSSLHGVQSPSLVGRDAGVALRDAREEANVARQQLEQVKAENESLARRVKELEREVRRMKNA